MAPHLLVDVPLGGRLPVPACHERSGAPGSYAVCEVCHGPAAVGRRTCWSCKVAAGQLGTLPPVVPIFLFGLGSPVHRALVGYKAGVTHEGRCARGDALAEMLAAWLKAHAGCLLAGGTGALVVPVPSSTGGRGSWHGRHPLESLCESAVEGDDRLRAASVLRPASRPPRRLQASRTGYHLQASRELPGRTAIVVDDMFVSGARALSAAAALSEAGIRVAAVVPLGRLVRPDHNEATSAFWAARIALRFDPAMCTRCAPTPASDRVSAWSIARRRVSERLAA